MCHRYQNYHYIEELAIAYHVTKVAIVEEMLQLGSTDIVPFHLVLRNWTTVDYANVSMNRGDTVFFKQISEALAGNAVLRSLRFASHQIDDAKLGTLCPTLAANRHLSEFSVIMGDGDGAKATVQAKDDKKRIADRQLAEALSFSAPAALIKDVLSTSSCGLRIVRLEGLILTGAQWATLPAAVATAGKLEQLHIHIFNMFEDVAPSQPELDAIAATASKAFLSVRSLKQLTLQRVPGAVLGAIMKGGVSASRSIDRLDLSLCRIDTDAQRELVKWLRRPKAVLRTLLLHNVRFAAPGATKNDDSSSTSAAQQLLRTLRGTRSQLAILLLTLNVADDGHAPGSRVCTQLTRAAKLAASASRSMEMFAFGFCHEDMNAFTDRRAKPGVISYAAKSITSMGRAGLNAIFCSDFLESDTDIILDGELEGADAAGRPNFDLWLVTAALARQKTDVLCVRLGNLQRPVALQVMGILRERVLAYDPKDERKTCLIIDACALQDRDMPALDELLPRSSSAPTSSVHDVVVRDNPITWTGLHRINPLGLRSFGFLSATPVPADIAIGLASIRERSQQVTMCTGLKNFDFASSSGHISQLRSFPKLDTAVLKVQQARGIIELNLSEGGCRGYSSADLRMLAQLLAFCPNLGTLSLSNNALKGKYHTRSDP